MNLAEFARWCVSEGPFHGCDLDGGTVQEKAEKCGIIRQVPYDPSVHGENDVGVEPGDPWLVFTDEFEAMIKHRK
jgi:hypothetical protein